MKWFVYGLFYRGECVYVGRTNNMGVRLNAHQRHERFRDIGRKLSIRAFRTLDSEEPTLRIEMQIIRAMRRQGKPLRNRTLYPSVRVVARAGLAHRLKHPTQPGYLPHANVTITLLP